MTPDQIIFFRKAVAEMKTVSVAAPQPHSAESLSDVLQRQGIKNGSIDFQNLTASGFTNEGIAAIADLAKSFRPRLSANSQRASNATLGKFIAAEITKHWRGRPSTTLETRDFEQLRKAVEEWFDAQNTVTRHVVPCTLFPHPTPSFSIGPVTFCHVHDFPSEEFGVSRDDFWPRPLPRWKHWMLNVWAAVRAKPLVMPKAGGLAFEHFLEFAASRHAPWMALIDVSGRAAAESARAADLAADVALAIIQLVSPGADMRALARATGRAAPVWRADISKTAQGQVSSGTSNQMPALARSPDMIARHIAEVQPAFDSMGRRLEAYLTAASPLPELNSAWYNAAYWYHEALAETLDTVAVAKLETAIEVLFRAESSTGSKRRLLESFDAIFGLGPNDHLDPAKTVTVQQIVLAITTARSCVLHGTWPTLHNDLPSQTGRLTANFGEVETLTRTLLLRFSLALDAYQDAGKTDDTTDAFISWIKADRLATRATTSTTP
jgi:hypothetical protein